MAEKKRRRRRYEAIGGPVCGSKFERTEDSWLGVEDMLAQGDEPSEHWYRLCVVSDDEGRLAKFWHYIGTEPKKIAPRLVPAEKHFR